MRSAPILAVDCGASHVAVARIVRARTGPPVLMRFAAEPVTAPDRDEEAWLEATAAALQALGRRLGMRGSCALGLPGHLLQLHSFTIPRVSGAGRRRLLRFEAAQALPAGREVLAWSAMAVGEDAGREQIVITAVRLAVLAAICRSAARAGFRPRAVFPSWLMAFDGAGARDGFRAADVAANVGARSTQIVVRTGTRRFIRNLGLGADLVGRRMAEELGPERNAVEVASGGIWNGTKSTASGAPVAMAAQLAADALARRLAGELGRLLASVRRGEEDPRPESLQVSGGGALTAGLSRALADLLVMSTVVPPGPPPAPATAGDDQAQTPLERCRATDAAALGACARRRECREANLLPRRLGRELRLARWRPLGATVAILLAAGLWWPIGCWRREGLRFGGEAAALADRIATIRGRIADEQGAQRRLEDMTRRAAALRRLVAARTAWPAFLADLEARLGRTGDVWLERLELQPAADTPAPAAKRPPGRSKAARVGPRAADAVRLRITGCVFDADHPLVSVDDACRERVNSLWANLAASPYVATLSEERLVAERDGILRFEVTLVMASRTLF